VTGYVPFIGRKTLNNKNIPRMFTKSNVNAWSLIDLWEKFHKPKPRDSTFVAALGLKTRKASLQV
jgi:hypothetical protein